MRVNIGISNAIRKGRKIAIFTVNKEKPPAPNHRCLLQLKAHFTQVVNPIEMRFTQRIYKCFIEIKLKGLH